MSLQRRSGSRVKLSGGTSSQCWAGSYSASCLFPRSGARLNEPTRYKGIGRFKCVADVFTIEPANTDIPMLLLGKICIRGLYLDQGHDDFPETAMVSRN